MATIDEFITSLENFDFSHSFSLLNQITLDERNRNIVSRLRELLLSHYLVKRSRKFGSLSLIRSSGFMPDLIIDVGAQVGTPDLYQAFPDVRHIFIEPVLECMSALNTIASTLQSALVINAAVTNFNGRVSISLSKNLQYSSILGGHDGSTREVESVTLDRIREMHAQANKFLVKIDVDGAEIIVLQGAREILASDSIFIIEASVAESFPRFQRLMDFMGREGYQVFDIVDPLYRPSDTHLWQVDLVFARSSSVLFQRTTFE
jgi:FkbM family methyltransferase